MLSAIPEVAAEYGTTGTVINISSALYMLFMGISPCFWGPASQIFGRRWVSFWFCFGGALGWVRGGRGSVVVEGDGSWDAYVK